MPQAIVVQAIPALQLQALAVPQALAIQAMPALQLQAPAEPSVLPELVNAEIAIAPSIVPSDMPEEAGRWSPISPTQPFAEVLPSQDDLDNIFEEDALVAVPAPAPILRPRSTRIVLRSSASGQGSSSVPVRRPRRIVVASAPPLLRPPIDPAVLISFCSAYYSAQIHGPHFPVPGVSADMISLQTKLEEVAKQCRYRRTQATHPYQDTAAWSISVSKNGEKIVALAATS